MKPAALAAFPGGC